MGTQGMLLPVHLSCGVYKQGVIKSIQVCGMGIFTTGVFYTV